MRPTLTVTGIGAILIITSIIWFIMKWKDMSEFERLVTFIIICILIVINVIAYYVIEIYYDFNSVIGKWEILDEPVRRLRNLF